MKWLTDMAATKLLYLSRPRFVAISDSYVRRCLGISDGPEPAIQQKAQFCAHRMLAVQRGVRQLGLSNKAALDELYAYANSLPPVVPAAGPLRGESIPVRLSKVRILDTLLWADVAIYGEQPHEHWRAWYEREIAASGRQGSASPSGDDSGGCG